MNAPLRLAKQFRGTFLVFLFLTSTQVAGLSTSARAAGEKAQLNDCLAYWSAAHQILHRANPYSGEAILRLEREAGFQDRQPLIMRNPPWVLFLVAGLGLFPYHIAQRIWLVGGLAAVLVSVRWLWELYRDDQQALWTASLMTGLFSPIAAGLAIGQISPLALLGVAGFLHYEHHGHLGRAGAFLSLLAVKPHLAFLFWIALILWSIRTSTQRVLASLCLTILAASVFALAFNPFVFAEYFRFLASDGFVHGVTPTPAGLVRLEAGGKYLLQFLPALFATLWLCLYWRRNRSEWHWKEKAPLVLAVSVCTSPYSWFFDQIILLPCLFQSISDLRHRKQSVQVGLAGLYLSVNFAVLALILMQRSSAFGYAWTAGTWLLLYLIVRQSNHRKAVSMVHESQRPIILP